MAGSKQVTTAWVVQISAIASCDHLQQRGATELDGGDDDQQDRGDANPA
jgi:hypothetical protein